MTYYPTLHTLRGFAALWVLLLHSWIFSGQQSLIFAGFLSFGWVGVHLFYLLSAFLLGSIYFQNYQKSTWKLSYFYKRRFLRIFPAYYFQLAILLLLSVIGVYYKFPPIQNLIAHLFLFLNLPPTFDAPMNGVWWTLPIEFGFYLILPLLAKLLIKFGVYWFLILVFVITYLYRYTIFTNMHDKPIIEISNVIGQLPGVLMVFSIGLVSAFLLSKNNNIFNRLQNSSVTITALILLFIWANVLLNTENYWSGSHLLYFWDSVNAFLIMVLILSIYQSQSKIIANNVLVWLGKVSYGIYLWHLPVILISKTYIHSFYLMFAVTLPITLVLASISYYFVEKKFSQLKS